MAGDVESPLAGVTYDGQRGEDFYTLLNFARLTALAVIRGADEARLDEAREAIGVVDEDRVDFRDVAVASALIENPAYFSGGDTVHAVWFSEQVETELAGLRATMSLTAQLDPATEEEVESQQFTVFLAEAATEDDAARLAAAAVPADWFEALGVAAGRICAVTVARSQVKDVAAYEQPGSLERFREPFAATLRAPGG